MQHSNQTARPRAGVAPLNNTSLNPVLSQKKPRETRLSSSSQPSMRKAAKDASTSASLSRSASVQRIPSPTPSDNVAFPRRQSFTAVSGTKDATDWKDFVKSLSGSDISRAWEGSRDVPSMNAASRGRTRSSANIERRKSHLRRIQKELEQDSQYEHIQREPGVVQQDLLARAASAVVGTAPSNEYSIPDGLRPGSVVISNGYANSAGYDQRSPRTSLERRPLSPPLRTSSERKPSNEAERPFESQSDQFVQHGGTSNTHHRTPSDLSAASSGHKYENPSEGDSDSYDDSQEDFEDASEEAHMRQQHMLEVVREEDEESSTYSHGRTSTSQSSLKTATPQKPKYRAFQSVIDKSRFVPYHIAAQTPLPRDRPSDFGKQQESIDSMTTDGCEETISSEDEDQSESSHANPHVTVSEYASSEDKGAQDDQSLLFSKDTLPNPLRQPLDLKPTLPPKSPDRKIVSLPAKASEPSNDGNGSDTVSLHSVQTGRATVTFDKKANAPSISSSRRSSATSKGMERSASLNSGPRPGTLPRRLSDLSLGTSFGLSGILRNSSRSSRRLSLSDDDGESSKGQSDDDDNDEELKQRIKAEQERLRNMKVGEDFFGGSLSEILDRFDNTDWSVGKSSAVNHLGLDVGAPMTGSSENDMVPQAILDRNIQERINEVRRKRTDDNASHKHQHQNSETKTIDSGVAPSFAAIWLLNQNNDIDSSAEAKNDDVFKPSAQINGIISNQRSDNEVASQSQASGTLSSDASKASVLSRPRPRGPKPKEMGGKSIARGFLQPDTRVIEEPLEDNRSTLDHIWRVEEDITLQSEPKMLPSKHKPKPLKPAIKGGKTSRSLADTLFEYPSEVNNESTTGTDFSETNGEHLTSANATPCEEEKIYVQRITSKHGTDSELGINDRSTSNGDEADTDGTHARVETIERDQSPGAPSQSPLNIEEVGQSNGVAQSEKMPVEASNLDLINDRSQLRSPPAVSELWSGESAESNGTGPVTPGTSDFNEDLSPSTVNKPSPVDKKLPLPPLPDFADDTVSVRSKTLESDDQNKTPMAEEREPSFGVNLIPPTPPAAADSHQHNLTTQNLVKASESPKKKDAILNEPSIQRSTSVKSAGVKDGSVSRRTSTKHKSLQATNLGEYQGRGLSLPPGLIATTVATSSSRRHSTHNTPAQLSSGAAEVKKAEVDERRKKAKAQKNTRTRNDGSSYENRYSHASPDSHQSMQRSASEALESLMPPQVSDYSDTASSRGSDSLRLSQSTSPAPSPSISLSGRSSAFSSSSPPSEASSSRGRGPRSSPVIPPPIPRKIRTVTAGPNGHARTSLMSAISEWENSPIDARTRSLSPSPLTSSASGHISPVEQAPPSGRTLSQSSVYNSPSPSIMRNAPIGAPTDVLLAPSRAQEKHKSKIPYASSLDGHGLPMWQGSNIDDTSEYSVGVQSQHSITSLPNVPQSSYRAKDPIKASNNIDDRLYAKTTMSTVAVTSGAFRKGSTRQRKTSHTSHDGGSPGRKSLEGDRDGSLVEELHKTTMSLTSHTPPPRKLSSTQVLVQVITVAVDEMDRLILRDKVRSESAYGFIPGRNFCGRIMETGWEVKRLRIGDVIFGLQSSKKNGALAEFLVIEQDLVSKAPEDCLTMEQISALPSVGVLAHQLMVNHCSQLPRGARILILNAHDGVGLLTMQECAGLGLIIVAHCPQHVSDGVAICEANGAHEVIVGEPLWALNTLHESSFDLVIDTLGGRRIYDAARRILAFEGQFCTCFGDLHSSTANPNLRSHLRSLRRSFFKKDQKHIGYEWVGTDTAEDCHEALEAVRRAAEDGRICPRLNSVLGFAEAPRAFEGVLRGTNDESGAVVVRVS